MDFKTRHIGSYGGNPAKIIELTVEGWNSTITEDVTDLKGNVDENLIMALRNLADELEEHNLKKASGILGSQSITLIKI